MSKQENPRRKILLIDDDASLLATLSDFLRYEGYDVVTAESGEAGLERLKTVRPDLIVLDMSMPGMGGQGFLKAITARDGSLRHPVLVLTARASMAEFFADTQVDGFVAKPCDPADLLMEIGRIIFLRSGEAVIAGAKPLAVRRSLLLAESDKTVSDALREALTEAGFDVEPVFRGPDALEAAVLSKPDVILLRLELDAMSADAIVRLLKQMANTADIPVVVYGIDAPGVNLEHVASLDERQARLLPGLETAKIVAAATKSAART